MHEWDIDRCRYVVYLCIHERTVFYFTCVCVRERGASVTQQPSLSIRPSLARSHATHASTRTFWHPHPAPAHLKARTISSWIPISLLRFVFSQYLTHTHTERDTHAAQHTHTHSPEHTIHPHPRLYGDHSRLCFFAPQHAQHLNLQRGHRADRRRRPHRARECGVIWKQGDVTTADWLLPPPSLSLSCTKLPIPLSPAQNCQSLNPRDPSPLVHVFPALSSNMLSLLLPRIQNPDAHASHVYYMYASFSQT